MKNLLHSRRRAAELMDDPNVDPQMLSDSLRFIRRINSLLGYTRVTIRHLARFSRRWQPGQRINILDIGSGSADIPLAILKWASLRGHDIRIVAVDRHAQTARAAAAAVHAGPKAIGRVGGPNANAIQQAANAGDRLKIIQSDALALPFSSESFEYAICSMFLHHLSDEQVNHVLRSMDRVAKRGIIVSDLLRTRRAHAWIKLFTCRANAMVRHDAVVSVEQAFTPSEVLALRDLAQLRYLKYFHHFAHRFSLAGEKL